MENIEILTDYASGEMTLNEMNKLFNDEYYQEREKVREYTNKFVKGDLEGAARVILSMAIGITSMGPLFFKDLCEKLHKDFGTDDKDFNYATAYVNTMRVHLNTQLYDLRTEIWCNLLDWTKIIERYLGISYSEQCKYFGLFGENGNHIRSMYHGITLNYGKKHIKADYHSDGINGCFMAAIVLLRFIKKYNMEKIIEQNQDNEMFISMLNGFNQLRSMLNEFFNSTDSEKKVHELYDNK